MKKPALLIATAAVLSSLSACGGGSDDGTGVGGTGGGGGTGQNGGASYVYVTTADPQNLQVAGSVLQYRVGSNGSLTPLSVASLPTGVSPVSVVSDPAG